MLELFRSRSIILMYHRIASAERDPWGLCVTPQHFAEHLEVLRKYRTVRLADMRPGRWSINSAQCVALTFDDGYADNLYQALPLLKRFDTPATFFIATGYLDSPGEFWWDELERVVYARNPPAGLSIEDWHLQIYRELQPLSHVARRQILDQMLAETGQPTSARVSHRVLTFSELAELASEKCVEIGAHTITHPRLSTQSVSEQTYELRGSRQALEGLTDGEVTSLSYPYGGSDDYTQATVKAASESGFRRACTTNAKCIRDSDNRFEWGRIQVPDVDGDGFEEFLRSTL